MHHDEIKPMVDAIADTLKKIGEPLSDNQTMVLVGALAIFMETFENEVLEQVRKLYANP